MKSENNQSQIKSMKPFMIVWAGQAVSLFGSAIVQFALIWWLTLETGSATILATASLVGLVPQVVLGPFVGVLVDRWPRRLTMIVSDGLIMVATLGLAYLFWTDVIQVWHVFVLLFVRALGGAFHRPSFQASTVLMVPKSQLTRIQGFNQILEGSLGIVSAPLGAILLGVMSMQGILAIDVVTAVFAIVPLFFILIPQPEKQQPVGGQKTSYWEELRAGFRYVWSWKGILLLMMLAMLVNLVLTPLGALLPLLVTDHFGGDAVLLSISHSLFGIGIIVGGITLSAWGGFKRRIITTIVGLIGLGFGFFVMGLAPSSGFWIGAVAAFFAGSMIAMVNGPVRAIFQAVIAPEMQGRVLTLLGSAGSAMSPLGLIIAGPAADLFGIRYLYIFAGAVVMLTGVAGFFIPALLRVEDQRPGEERLEPVGMVGETAVAD
ncbi:MAG: MFS transporter [Chloroflexi bacterium]|nr:MFS transporter [Chloroflexota bacterium]